MQLASNLSKAKAVQKPYAFKGKQGSNAHRFLAVFMMWAHVQGTTLNTLVQYLGWCMVVEAAEHWGVVVEEEGVLVV